MTTASEIIANEKNQEVLLEFFKGDVSGDYWDGRSYQLYLDTDDDTLSINMEASDSTWLQRDDGSLIQVYRISGYDDRPKEERYTDDCDLNDYGYGEFIDMIERKIALALQ